MLSGNFYPRPPGGGRLALILSYSAQVTISIHALRVEGDPVGPYNMSYAEFISIHALRVEGDHHFFYTRFAVFVISIHALRVEGD